MFRVTRKNQGIFSIWLCAALLMVAGYLIGNVAIRQSSRSSFRRDVTYIADSTAIALSALASKSEIENFSNLLGVLSEHPDFGRVEFRNARGDLVYDSGKLDENREYERIERIVYNAEGNGGSGKPTGTLMLYMSPLLLEQELSTIAWVSLLFLLIFLGTLRVVISISLKRTMAPIEKICLAMERYALGDAGCELPNLPPGDPIEPLADTFRSMRRELDAFHSTLDFVAKERAKDLNEAREVIEAAYKAKRDFLAGLSHEIRTPINGVLGVTDLLLDTPLNEEQRDYLATLKASADALLNIINDILDFSKIEAGKLKLNAVGFSMKDRIRQLEQLFNVRIAQKDISFLVEMDKDVPDRLIGDPLRLNQVLINLIGNSLKFTPEGGGLLVFIELAESRNNECTLRFTVSDSGIGIEPEAQQCIFNPFEQAKISNAQNYGGTGLGLTICKTLVEMMGGDIRVRSIPGLGSSFQFTAAFGVPTQAEASPVERNSEAPLTNRPLHILLAEDNLVNQKLAMSLLQKAGHSVSLARNGEEALRIYGKERFDVILMDIEMPLLDGLEATRRIREAESESKAHVPIIAMTAHALEGHREECLEAGMDDYIAKPIDRILLLKTLQTITAG